MKTITGLTFGLLLISQVFASSVHADDKDATPSQNKSTEKTVKIVDIRKTRFLPVLYVVEVEVCAGKDKLYSPWLEIKSDMDTIRVKVTGLIMPNSCKTAEFFILAGNPDSISVDFATISYRDYPRVANQIIRL